MRKRALSLLLIFCMLFSITPFAASASSAVPTERQAYERMMALKTKYPDGTRWTNANAYTWKGGIYNVGYGCAGFAFMLSDAAFGDLSARIIRPVSFDSVKAGDILRVNNDTHSVIVLEKQTNKVVIAEGNYNSAVKWGRTMTAAEVNAADYLMTRYPAGSGSASSVPSSPAPSGSPSNPSSSNANRPSGIFADMRNSTAWYNDCVDYVVSRGLMNGTGSCFSPNGTTTRAQIVAILYNLEGKPSVYGGAEFSDISSSDWCSKAVQWAFSKGIVSGTGENYFSPNKPVTREELAVMLCNYAKYKGCITYSAESLNRFSDSVSCSSWANSAMSWCVDCGIISGSDGKLMPKAFSTRAQAAAMLKNFCENFKL